VRAPPGDNTVLAAAICVFLILITASRWLGGKQPPLDRDELRVLRRLSDRTRIEQRIPFE
jgi:hypothetical protein